MMVIRASEKCTDNADRDSQAKISNTEENSRSPSPLLPSAYETTTSNTFPMQLVVVGGGGEDYKRKKPSQSLVKKEINVNSLYFSSPKPSSFPATASPGRAKKRKKHSETENTHSNVALASLAKQDIPIHINQLRQGTLRQEDINAELLYQPEENGSLRHSSSWATIGSSEAFAPLGNLNAARLSGQQQQRQHNQGPYMNNAIGAMKFSHTLDQQQVLFMDHHQQRAELARLESQLNSNLVGRTLPFGHHPNNTGIMSGFHGAMNPLLFAAAGRGSFPGTEMFMNQLQQQQQQQFGMPQGDMRSIGGLSDHQLRLSFFQNQMLMAGHSRGYPGFNNISMHPMGGVGLGSPLPHSSALVDRFSSNHSRDDSNSAAATFAKHQVLSHQALYTRENTSNMEVKVVKPVLYMSNDDDALSDYQCLVRKQIEVFEAGSEDVESNAQGRNKPIILDQVGIRCRHCSSIPPRHRTRGATYYPAKLQGLYQAAQNMASSHLCNHCQLIPDNLRQELVILRDRKSLAGGGKQYWADGVAALGVVEGDWFLHFKNSSRHSATKKGSAKESGG